MKAFTQQHIQPNLNSATPMKASVKIISSKNTGHAFIESIIVLTTVSLIVAIIVSILVGHYKNSKQKEQKNQQSAPAAKSS